MMEWARSEYFPSINDRVEFFLNMEKKLLKTRTLTWVIDEPPGKPQPLQFIIMIIIVAFE